MCPNVHQRRMQWLSSGKVQGEEHQKFQFMRTWEVIRQNNLHSYDIVFNDRYTHVNHLRAEMREEDFDREAEESMKVAGGT